MRWSGYVMERGQRFLDFWRGRLKEGHQRRVLFIAGLGFDPRTPIALESLAECCQQNGERGATIDVRLLHFDEGPDSISQQYAAAVGRNAHAMRRAVEKHGRGTITDLTIPMIEEDRRVGGWRVGPVVLGSGLTGYDDVIVDVSALPRTLYFPLVHALLDYHGETGGTNLHLVLFEDATLDAAIREELTERADYLPGFLGSVDLHQDDDMPRIWSPVLGEGQEPALRLIEQKINVTDNPPEVCPVLPFPAVDPRRGDRLLVEYAPLLASWKLDLRNIIYASEHNPFDVYRQLCRLYDQYSKALQPLRGAKMIVSAHSSKLLSLGALLAAYDRPEIAVAHVEAQGYHVDRDLNAPVDGELCEIWIAGDPYIA